MVVKKIISSLLVILCLTFLSGCATVSKQEAMTADFGPLPAGYQDEIKAFISPKLKDPYSAVYDFGIPRKGAARDGLIFGCGKHYGWIIPVGINAKNSFGGYTGEQQFIFMLSEGRVSDITTMMGQMASYAD